MWSVLTLRPEIDNPYAKCATRRKTVHADDNERDHN